MRTGRPIVNMTGYLCRAIGGWGSFEAWTIDGSIHWRHDNRIRTFKDQEKYRKPMVYCTVAFSAEKTGQKTGSFTVTLAHCDPTKDVEAFRGNTIIEQIDIVFRRRVPPHCVPKFIAVV